MEEVKNDDDVVKGYFEFDVGKFIDYEDVKNIRNPRKSRYFRRHGKRITY